MIEKILVFLFISNFFFAQEEEACFFLKDKPNAPAFLSDPLSELTQRSLDKPHVQGIVQDVSIDKPYVNQITMPPRIIVLVKSKWLNYLHVRGTQVDMAALSNLSFVDYVQYINHVLNTKLNSQNKTVLLEGKLAMNTSKKACNYGNSETQIQMLKGHILHQQNYTDAGKIMAIFDAGFPSVNTTASFANLRYLNLILRGYDFVTDSNYFYIAHLDDTSVLSIIGANTTNLIKITSDVVIEKVIGSSNWVEVTEEANRLGVDVINSFLDNFDSDTPNHSYECAHMNSKTSVASRAVDTTFLKGTRCVISIGKRSLMLESHISTPADAKNTVTVRVLDSSRILSSFTRIGTTADNHIKSDLMAMGTSFFNCDMFDNVLKII
ncbi:S8 family serine peptidase [Flavobacterium oreochromis]|uniref:S8 family serine peptidase n=2 Tax=Flavobacterium oreochromis TaxID=2906078 RepID=UPI00385F94BF